MALGLVDHARVVVPAFPAIRHRNLAALRAQADVQGFMCMVAPLARRQFGMALLMGSGRGAVSLHNQLTPGEWEVVALLFVIGVAWFCIKGMN
jgi:hypothetical protein